MLPDIISTALFFFQFIFADRRLHSLSSRLMDMCQQISRSHLFFISIARFTRETLRLWTGSEAYQWSTAKAISFACIVDKNNAIGRQFFGFVQ